MNGSGHAQVQGRPTATIATTSRTRQLSCLYGLLLAGNVGAWLWALTLFANSSVLMSTAVFAYVLGMRHAVDADHIAAIDNVVRKLVQQGLRPISVGLHFSLGHSTVVALACVGIALTSISLKDCFMDARQIGALMGAGVSAGFLFAIAFANVMTMAAIWRDFRRAGENIEPAELKPTGLIGRSLKRVVDLITAPWQMYPLGFLFGLGFDTASEVSILGISASQAVHGAQLWTIMVFPALFTAGMTMIDTTDSLLMEGAYGWALKQPGRKLIYNFTITGISVLAAVAVGAFEVMGLAADKLALTGPIWKWIEEINLHFGAIGCGVAGALIAAWGISLFWARRRYGIAAPS